MKLFECDNCGQSRIDVHKTLRISNTVKLNIGYSTGVSPKKYHICEDCWYELGWDE